MSRTPTPWGSTAQVRQECFIVGMDYLFSGEFMGSVDAETVDLVSGVLACCHTPATPLSSVDGPHRRRTR